MKPIGRARKAYENGLADAQKGKEKKDNPYQRLPNRYLDLRSWWDRGWDEGRGL